MIFVSIVAYVRDANPDVLEELKIRELAAGERAELPAFRTVNRLRKLTEVTLHIETQTPIARARSHAAGVFLQTGLDDWLSLDGDLDVSEEALKALIAARGGRRIVFGAYRLRRRPSLSIATSSATFTPGRPFPITAGGFGCVLAPRVALELVVEQHPELLVTEPGGSYPMVFLERVATSSSGGAWVGEDVAFCERARRAGVDLVAVLHSGILHDGVPPFDA